MVGRLSVGSVVDLVYIISLVVVDLGKGYDKRKAAEKRSYKLNLPSSSH